MSNIDSNDLKITYKESRLIEVAYMGNLIEVKELLQDKLLNINCKDSYGNSPLTSASQRGKTDVVKLLLEMKANVDIKDDRGWTPLHWASNNDLEEVLQLLLEKNSDLNIQDIKGATPLHYASEKGKFTAAKILLLKGANPNIQDNKGLTPLHRSSLGNIEILKLLLTKGADHNLKTVMEYHHDNKNVYPAYSAPIDFAKIKNKKQKSKELEEIITQLTAAEKKRNC